MVDPPNEATPPAGSTQPQGWNLRITQIASTLAAVLGIATTIIGYYTSVKATAAADSARKAQELLSERQESRLEIGAEREFSLRVFEKAYDALGVDKPQLQTAALALVISLPETPMRQNLIAAFGRSGASDEIRGSATRVVQAETEFSAQNKVDALSKSTGTSPQSSVGGTKVLASNSNGFDVDVFWCEGGDNDAGRQQLANSIGSAFAALSNSQIKIGGTTLGQIRIRMLPSSKNAQPQYRLTTNVITFDTQFSKDAGIEPILARELAKKAFDVSNAKFEVVPGSANTKWYLPVFVCG